MLQAFCSILALSLFCAATGAREFDLKRDTFAFSNDTVLQYGVDEQGRLQINRRDQPVAFGHRCFVLSRAVLQFHQFVRFDAKKPRLSREEYRRLVRRIFRIPVWSRGPSAQIVLPGYADLHSFSVAYEGLLKETVGNWVPSYLRVGNWRMAWPFPRAGQAAAARWLAASMERGQPRALYIARFPKMNHVVVASAMRRQPNGDLRFTVYDPNYPNEPTWIDYQPAARSFQFPRRWYFPGGQVNVMRVFISPIH